MSILKSAVSTESEDFDLNRQDYEARIARLHAYRREARFGALEKDVRRHVDHRGQILPRDRIKALLDPGSPFLELGELAGLGLYDDCPPGGSLITGVGKVSGRHCMIIVNDATVKGGTYYPITCRKHVRAQRFAWRHRLPCITFVQSGGGFLPEQAGIFPDKGMIGSIFHNQVGMSADGIAQIAVVFGSSTAGGAYIPALCDEVVIVRGKGFMYLGGPQLTFAATGEVIGHEELGGAEMHCRVSGVTDHIAEDDSHALAITREIVANLGTPPKQRWRVHPPKEPRYDPREIYGIISRDKKIPHETREVLMRLVDDSYFQEFKALYGDTLMCGFARIKGFDVGILCNRGVLFAESARKGAHFIELCVKRDIPLLFLSDVSGFMVGRAAEEAGIAKAGAQLITAMTSAKVPKYTVYIGASYGAGYLAMCGRPFDPTATFFWPNGHAAIMGPDQVANTLWDVRMDILKRQGKKWTAKDEAAFKDPLRQSFEDFSQAYNFASHDWTDGVIDPVETRDVLALCFDIAGRVPAKDTKFGIFRH